jgi:hypothetical protein
LNTQGVSSAQITFEGAAPVVIKPHGAKRAGMDAHLAADAQIVVNNGSHMLIVSMDGFLGAGCRAGRVFAMLAGEGQIPAKGIQRYNTNPGSFRIANAGFSH